MRIALSLRPCTRPITWGRIEASGALGGQRRALGYDGRWLLDVSRSVGKPRPCGLSNRSAASVAKPREHG